MAQKANKSKKAAAAPRLAAKPRVRKLNRKNKKKVVKTFSSLPGSFRLFGRAVHHIWQHKRLFGGILAVYFILYVLLVKGLAANFQLNDTKDLVEEALGGELGNLELSTVLFGTLLGTAGSTAGEAGSVYQVVLFVIFSLAIIWALRQTHESDKRFRTRQAFYQGSYPLVQYILVGLVILLQFIPALIGLSIYSVVASNGIAVGAIEQIAWLVGLVLCLSASVYLISSSLFASYIVTLRDMTPMRALRAARKLVKYRRWSIIRKVVFLPFVLLLFTAAVFLPLVITVPILAEILFLVFSLIFVLISHAYFYGLYRELL